MTVSTDPIRETFVARFGEDQATRIENAAREHIGGPWGGGIHTGDDHGSSPFRYWFLGAISYECLTRYANDHGITVAEDDLRDWALTEGRLGEHEGDVPDYIGLIAGAYDGWVVPAESAEAQS